MALQQIQQLPLFSLHSSQPTPSLVALACKSIISKAIQLHDFSVNDIMHHRSGIALVDGGYIAMEVCHSILHC